MIYYGIITKQNKIVEQLVVSWNAIQIIFIHRKVAFFPVTSSNTVNTGHLQSTEVN